MASYLSSLPDLAEFFPPTPRAFAFTFNTFRTFAVLTSVQWSPLITAPMGKTSMISRLNLPGRFAWTAAEIVGPLNLIYILYSLPSKLVPPPSDSTSFLGTGLPAHGEILGLLYVLHYLNRAIIAPLFLAPSMSPIHPLVTVAMATFQSLNSTNIACWIVYSLQQQYANPKPLVSFLSVLGILLYAVGLAGNIRAENTLFSLRRGAAKRKAKSEGKAVISYDKVYVVPPPEGFFKSVLYPHYVLEWVEWAGYWILGAAWGLGWGNQSAAAWFVLSEVLTMLPRAVSGKRWYEKKFGKRAVGGRAAAIPLLGL